MERCYKCFKPQKDCLCKFTHEFDPGIKFIFLMHPKESKRNRTGTGHLAHISLKDSEIIVGLDFTQNQHLTSLLNDPKYFPLLLYPGETAWTSKTEGFFQAVDGRIPLVLVLDATWFCAKKMIEHNLWLLNLPRLSFHGDYRSIFTFKHEPRPEYISTIESCYYLIKELQEINLAKNCDPECLMDVFKQMITLQLTAENERIMGIRPNTHAYDVHYNKIREVPKFE